MHRKKHIANGVLFAITLVIITLTALLGASWRTSMFDLSQFKSNNATAQSNSLVRIAVLGDSDSHSYQDHVLLTKPHVRGGAYRASTWQWTEALARLRPRHIDMGAWGVWGTRVKIADVLSALGLPGRAPRKEDYRYNFAISGAECDDLMSGPYRQTPRLVSLMDQEPAAWRGGVVSIRIGINSLGQVADLDRFAADRPSAVTREKVLGCVEQIRHAVQLIRSHHPETRIVLVGILDNANWPRNFSRWRSREALVNITAALDIFDNGLRAMAERDVRIAFFDDRAWFSSLWGERTADGLPAYGTVQIDGRTAVTNTAGDPPGNAVLADGHAGVVWNALWAQAFVELLRHSFSLAIPPITEDEIVRFIDKGAAYGAAVRESDLAK